MKIIVTASRFPASSNPQSVRFYDSSNQPIGTNINSNYFSKPVTIPEGTVYIGYKDGYGGNKLYDIKLNNE